MHEELSAFVGPKNEFCIDYIKAWVEGKTAYLIATDTWKKS